MEHHRLPQIDPERCTGCGLCLEVCPTATLTRLKDGGVAAGGSRCFGCGHCAAVCPAGALRVEVLGAEISRFATFSSSETWLAPGSFDPDLLVRIMRSRRSCRNYLPRTVGRDLLEDLVKIGITAPSGTNSQKWTFTILATRPEVEALGDRIAGFFRKLNRLARNPLARFYSRCFGGDKLGNYYRQHYHTTAEGLRAWETEGRDLLFHGATAAILVGSRPGASCPAEDALLATQNILLGAHALGLGTCLIGFAVEALQHEPAIKELLTIPREEPVHAVIALGFPEERYQRVCGRKPPVIRSPELHHSAAQKEPPASRS